MNLWRQQDIVDGGRLAVLPITVIGAGATGSFITLALAKMGAQDLTVYDDDTVEDHNLPNQFYRPRDVTKPKVLALKEIVADYSDTVIDARPVKYVDQPLEGIVIVCVDKMDARRVVWEQVRYRPQVRLLVDTRMGAEVAVVHTVNPIDPDAVQHYESTLYTSGEAYQARCTEKAIVYTALGVAAIACGKVKKFLMAEPYEKTLVRDFRLSMLTQPAAVQAGNVTGRVQQLESLVVRLLDWEAEMGHWDAPVWADARRALGRPS